MKHYTFNIIETREITLGIDAESIREAERLAHETYYDNTKKKEADFGDELNITLRVYGYENDDDSECF